MEHIKKTKPSVNKYDKKIHEQYAVQLRKMIVFSPHCVFKLDLIVFVIF